MKVSFTLNGILKNNKTINGIMKLRINPKSWLTWCKEGTQLECLQATCIKKIEKQFSDYTMGEIKLPKSKSFPHLDFSKFLRSGTLGIENEVICTTNKKGMFGPNYKPKPFNPVNFGKRKHEYI